jgi:hypothetical protein
MGDGTLPTVKVKLKGTKTTCIINQVDFDASLHELVDPKKKDEVAAALEADADRKEEEGKLHEAAAARDLQEAAEAGKPPSKRAKGGKGKAK